ncbi:hypothetical protein [Saccharopolyspora cebuensis]|uniref:Uncharacterized protein n=1 Tax=Saccharopolyspora cebuensis TaxID=418759 RepID=A0ABV4CQ29_9PSEU
MTALGWVLAALAAVDLAVVELVALGRCLARHARCGRHGRAGPGATTVGQLLDRCRPAPPAPRPPRRVTIRGDLADALADEPTRLLPRVEPEPARDPELLRRVLAGLRAL